MDASAASSSLQYVSDSATGSVSTAAVTGPLTLGRWTFDKVTRKRKYVDLTGQTLAGWKAQVQAQVDKRSAKHPDRNGRLELEYLVGRAPSAIDAGDPEQLRSMQQLGGARIPRPTHALAPHSNVAR